MKNILIKHFFYFLLISMSIIGGFSVAEGQFSITPPSSAEKVEFFVDWSAQTFVPPDYNGKPLPTFKSIVNVSATPMPAANQKINENSYTFNWTLDNSSSLSSNKSQASFDVINGQGDDHKIYLRIFDKDFNLVNEYFMTIPIVSQEVAVYKKNDGLANIINGIIYVSAGSKLDLVAKPFFFSNVLAENQLIYRWQLNGESANKDTLSSHDLEISFPENVPSGAEYELSLAVENPFNAYQLVEKKYTIIVK